MFKPLRSCRNNPLISMLHLICSGKKQGTTKSWATLEEVQQIGLVPDPKAEPSMQACYVGGYPDDNGKLHYLQHAGAEHIIAFAPSNQLHHSGAVAGLVLPTLLGGWRESVVVHDIYDELYALTAGYRQKLGHKVLKFNPSSTSDDPQCCHFNPLEEVRIGTPFEVKDAIHIAAMLADPYGEGLNNHWQKVCFSLLVCVILHVLYVEPDKTLHGVATFLKDITTQKGAFDKMLSVEHDPDGQYHWKNQRGEPVRVHPVITQVAEEMACKQANEFCGVLSTVNYFLTPYLDPTVTRWTAYSDFRVVDLQDGESPISLFLVNPPEDKKGCSNSLTRLVLDLIAFKLTSSDRLVEKDGSMECVGKHPLLLLLDEFPSLGKMDVFQDTIAVLARYNVKLYLTAQEKTQLEDETHAYGKPGSQAIIHNCPVKIIYPPNDVQMAEWVSQQLGTDVLAPDDILRMRGCVRGVGGTVLSGDMLILVDGHKPIFGQQILCVNDPVLSARSIEV